ncbi:MAG TPA: hypothetical protein VFM18_14050 [Methanosarcina sp.]|nr:hypothetical protein [Methanosarcina sp.]
MNLVKTSIKALKKAFNNVFYKKHVSVEQLLDMLLHTGVILPAGTLGEDEDRVNMLIETDQGESYTLDAKAEFYSMCRAENLPMLHHEMLRKYAERQGCKGTVIHTSIVRTLHGKKALE